MRFSSHQFGIWRGAVKGRETHSCCLRISSISAFSALLLALRALSSSFSSSDRWAFFIASIAEITHTHRTQNVLPPELILIFCTQISVSGPFTCDGGCRLLGQQPLLLLLQVLQLSLVFPLQLVDHLLMGFLHGSKAPFTGGLKQRTSGEQRWVYVDQQVLLLISDEQEKTSSWPFISHKK